MPISSTSAIRKLAMLAIGVGIVVAMLYACGLLMTDIRDSTDFFSRVAAFDLMVVSGAALVYHDARVARIGPVPRQRDQVLMPDVLGRKDQLSVSDIFGLNLSAGAIGAFVAWWWVIILPLYLVKRRELIERARLHPYDESSLGLFLSWIALFVVSSPVLVIAYQV